MLIFVLRWKKRQQQTRERTMNAISMSYKTMMNFEPFKNASDAKRVYNVTIGHFSRRDANFVIPQMIKVYEGWAGLSFGYEEKKEITEQLAVMLEHRNIGGGKYHGKI